LRNALCRNDFRVFPASLLTRQNRVSAALQGEATGSIAVPPIRAIVAGCFASLRTRRRSVPALVGGWCYFVSPIEPLDDVVELPGCKVRFPADVEPVGVWLHGLEDPSIRRHVGDVSSVLQSKLSPPRPIDGSHSAARHAAMTTDARAAKLTDLHMIVHKPCGFQVGAHGRGHLDRHPEPSGDVIDVGAREMRDPAEVSSYPTPSDILHAKSFERQRPHDSPSRSNSRALQQMTPRTPYLVVVGVGGGASDNPV
jgi:hypothetical protein